MTRSIRQRRVSGEWPWRPTLSERLSNLWWQSRALRMLLLASLVGVVIWIGLLAAIWFTITQTWIGP